MLNLVTRTHIGVVVFVYAIDRRVRVVVAIILILRSFCTGSHGGHDRTLAKFDLDNTREQRKIRLGSVHDDCALATDGFLRSHVAIAPQCPGVWFLYLLSFE